MAQLAGLTPRQLARLLPRPPSQTPREWLEEIKLSEAKRILRKGSRVKQTATELGYLHASSFCRAFKRKMGYSPRKYLTKGSAASELQPPR